MMTPTGTPAYKAPELHLFKRFTQKIDMWSLGVILFVMCTCTPLYGQPEDNAFLTIMKKGVGSLLNHYETFGLRLDHYARDLVIKLVVIRDIIATYD